jgi:hypothetical protein
MKQKTANDWLEEIVQQVGGKAEFVPDNWITITDIMEKLDMTNGEARVFIGKAMKANKMQKKQFRITTASNGVRLTWHYSKI